MTDLLAARSQMAMSLAFHIVFAIVGIGMPLLMVIAERMWLNTRQEVYRQLARQWAKGTAIMFAVGAVSGTVLSFELGLLWPGFMEYAGPIVGMPFSLEGFAFFLEAIFLGIYLYGWERVSERIHWYSGVAVFICGAASAVFVVCANAWMNTPAGFEMAADGSVISVDPWQAMFNPAAFTQVVHMLIATFVSIGFAVAGIHAYMLLKDRQNLFHRRAVAIGLVVGGFFSLLQPISGDLSAKMVAEHQPIKLAAMEGHWHTEARAGLHIGGWPDETDEVTRWAIEIPAGLSILAYGDADAEVLGLSDVEPDLRPPVLITHLAFQLMVGIGFLLMAVAGYGAWRYWRTNRLPDMTWYLKLLVLCAPMGFIAVEAGWVVTEVGRQPWVIYDVMRTADAVTPMPHLVVPFLSISVLYLFLSVVVVVLMKRFVVASPHEVDEVDEVDEVAEVDGVADD